METRALIRRRSTTPRAWYAAGLLVVLLAGLLGAWFISGWHDVRMRQAEVGDAPRKLAEQRAVELARELHAGLEALITREVRRPYFHYQNLMHDPKASVGVSVSPSPLARNPDDELVLGYFQIDHEGKTTTPTINDELPELSEPENLAENRAFRDQVARDLAIPLAPPPLPEPTPVMVAEVSPKPRPKRPARPRVQRPVVASADVTAPAERRPAPQIPATSAPPPQAMPPPQKRPQVVQLDPDVYVQNSQSNTIYWQQKSKAPMPPAVSQVPTTASESATPAAKQETPAPPATSEVEATASKSTAPSTTPAAKAASEKSTKPVKTASSAPAAPAAPATPVTITISPLEWQTHVFAGAPTLVAVRHVQTPDASLAQGFVIDRATLTASLAAKAGELVARLHVSEPQAAGTTEPGGAEVPEASARSDRAVDIAPGWQLTVSPNPRTLVEAAAAAHDIARTFLIRFFGLGALALVAAGSVLLLVLRAEKLARERSQFAAAAAHELRTPLAGLQLYGDMLADGLGDPAKVRDYARRMSEEASRLGRVVSNVLGFSQLERGNLAVEPQVGSLGEALLELAERAEPALDRAGAALELDVAPDLRARFDRDALARIIGNLLDNAEKYARGADDRTIRVAAHERGEVVEIVVQDHGPGVADRTKLFRPFSRGVTGDGPAGLGLGLALSQSLAEAMGGKLAYRSSEGRGATFVLELPRA